MEEMTRRELAFCYIYSQEVQKQNSKSQVKLFLDSTEVEDGRAREYVKDIAKGIKEKVVIWKHVFRNSMISVVTVVGLQFGFLLGGSVVTETVFAYPGLGSLLIESVNYRDYPAIQSLILIFSLQFIVINLIVDILYAVLNPEIKLQ